ncbi:MAG: pyruvate dehydrogenase (acetyl-transferring) E1 component subunit alpha [Anaerolineae bacterium]|nr:pyruvate dehydrogenase (acetyl-transferring) E1 component subunit alpha [Anaerolineae bacterium]
MATLKKETLLEWYRQMVLIRLFETRCDELYREKKITGVYLHLYSGHEAVGVGALSALKPSDHVITAYRDHGIAIARGVDPKPIMAEMMGKKTGTSGGKGGSMHIASREHNFWGGYAIVGGHLPLATGIGLACQYNETDDVVVSFIGDAATNNGYFHEALNMSEIWHLPVVWIIENNLVGMGTRIEDSSGQVELHKRSIAYGMQDGGRVDGQDVIAMNKAVSEAVAYARKKGPVLMEAMTYRYKGHGVSDKTYDKRMADELHEWMENKDPIKILQRTLVSKFKGIQSELDAITKHAAEQVDEATQYGIDSPIPTYEDLISNVYVTSTENEKVKS